MSRPGYIQIRAEQLQPQLDAICARLGIDPASRGGYAQAVEFAVQRTAYSYSNSGTCLRDALHQWGIDADIPPYPKVEDIPVICDRLGLVWHGEGTVDLGMHEWHVVLYATVNGRGHAELRVGYPDVEQERIIGVITKP